jgi:D-galactarolactone cycloisomerase
VFRAPIATPVVTSFGIMRDRPMVLVRVEDSDGVSGWGEVWCNFPTVGAEHRARLVEAVLAPMATAREFASPEAAFRFLSEGTAVLAIQSAEPGPVAQAIAGLDTAIWDLLARRAKLPLWKLLGGPSIGWESAVIPVYASGLNPEAPEKLAAARLAEGYQAFKLKVGFGTQRDTANLRALREVIGDLPLMVDANQAWDLDTAIATAKSLDPYGLAWLEEPLRADRPWSEWKQVATEGGLPLAGGENICGEDSFNEALAAGALEVVQPDMAKWGGFSGCLPVAKAILKRKKRYCPHFLGGGIGLLASAHLLAAVGGDGMLEVDANPNPLRSLCCGAVGSVKDGAISLGDAPGLGIDFEPASLAEYAVKL